MVTFFCFRLLTEPASLKPPVTDPGMEPRPRFRLLTEPASLKHAVGVRELLVLHVRVSGSSQSRPH